MIMKNCVLTLILGNSHNKRGESDKTAFPCHRPTCTNGTIRLCHQKRNIINLTVHMPMQWSTKILEFSPMKIRRTNDHIDVKFRFPITRECSDRPHGFIGGITPPKANKHTHAVMFCTSIMTLSQCGIIEFLPKKQIIDS